VNAMALFLLGRKLMQIAEAALPQGKGPNSVRLVLVDVAYHPQSSITDITERTGFPQSLVSTSVAKLRELGLVYTEPDPADRRRTLVSIVPTAVQERVEVRAAPADELLAKALGTDHEVEVSEAMAALETLAGLLTPEVALDRRYLTGDSQPD
jgi:DNA-binding MarR family transcriptional regulator